MITTQYQHTARVSSDATVLASIGNTPLFRLQHMPGSGAAEIWLKWEGANPTCSMKDRMALSMIAGAEKRGQLKPGGRVVEYTGGSTGSSLAMVCAAKGYRAHFVSSDAFAEEKLATMRAFGGIAAVKCVAVEPASSRHLSAGPVGGHRIEGIGPGFIPKIRRMELVSEIIPVTDEDAYNTARELARTEGVFGGISSGGNVFAALEVARKLGPGHRVVTVIVDSGLRYLQGDLFRK